MKKLIYLFLTVLIVACSSDDGNTDVVVPPPTSSDYSESCIYTLEVTNISAKTATISGGINIENCENNSIIEQGFVYGTSIQPTVNDNKINVNGTAFSVNLENLVPDTAYYVRTFLINSSGEVYGNEVSFVTGSVIYLADNGITIKAYDFASVGDTGVINGVTYTVVDEQMLRNGFNTNVVTTRVTDMSNLFFKDYDFNQPIGNWDVSNVTDMEAMFTYSRDFNQPIGNWDVSSVITMRRMFNNADDFNQPIGNWDVSSVTNMYAMFINEKFNQPIGNWDVSNVTDMGYMFAANNTVASFNQDLSSWNVDGVIECTQFSNGATNWTLPQPNFTNCTP